MAIDLTSTEALLLITDLILIIIVVYLADRLRKIKKNTKPTEEKQSLETVVPLEVKPDLSVVKINKPEKAELKPGDEVLVRLEEGGRHFGTLVADEMVIER